MKRIFIVVLTLCTFALADDDRYETHGYHLPKDLRHLELTQSQHQQVKRVLENYRAERIRLRSEQHDTARAIEALFMQESFDAARYKELKLQYEQASVVIESQMLAQLHALLSPSQRERFLTHLDEWIEE